MKDITNTLNRIKELHSQNLNDCEISKIINLSSSQINRLRHRLNLHTIRFQNNYDSNLNRLKGYIIRNIKFSAKRRNIEFDLHFKDIELPLYCPILNIELEYSKKFAGNEINRATVDRIDNSKGYIKGNVIIISRLANTMKNSANFEQLNCFSKNISILINNFNKNQGALGSITDIFPDIILKT